MFLAEAIKEKDFIENEICSLRDHIVNISVDADKTDLRSLNASIKRRFDELSALYKKYQQFSVSVDRAKANAFIELQSANNAKLSLSDAFILKDCLLHKLSSLKHIYDISSTLDHPTVDLEHVYAEMVSVKLDIKAIDREVDYAVWATEVVY